MAKKAYIGVDNKARKVKKIYIGVNNIARKVKKAYIGIGGVARPCFSGGELAYYGKIADMPTNYAPNEAATVGNYALFVGDSNNSAYGGVTPRTDAYNTALTQVSVTALPQYHGSNSQDTNIAATTVGNYALFAGGGDEDAVETDIVDAYDASLTLTTVTSLSQPRGGAGAITHNGYAMFAGGLNYSEYGDASGSDVVDIYNSSLTLSTNWLSQYMYGQVAAATVGNYALFAGQSGEYDTADEVWYEYSSCNVEGFDRSLTSVYSQNTFSINARNRDATTIGNYALFVGGYADGYLSVVEAVDSSLTVVSAPSLPYQSSDTVAVTLGDYAIVRADAWGASNCPEVTLTYNSSLTQEIAPASELSWVRGAVTTVGDYALFMGYFIVAGGNGGYTSDRRYVLDAYTV